MPQTDILNPIFRNEKSCFTSVSCTRKTLSKPVGALLTVFTCSEECKAPNNVFLYCCMWHHLNTAVTNYHSWTLLSGHFVYTFHSTFPLVNTPCSHCCPWHPMRTIKAYNTNNIISLWSPGISPSKDWWRTAGVLRHKESKQKNQDKLDERMLLENCSPVFAASVRGWWIIQHFCYNKSCNNSLWEKMSSVYFGFLILCLQYDGSVLHFKTS